MSRVLKYLRIAWTAVSIAVCVTLIAAWADSYRFLFRVDYQYSASHSFRGFVAKGRIYALTEEYYFRPNTVEFSGWELGSEIGFRTEQWHSIPFWIPVILMGFTAAAPWLRWRFSLRTLLTAITLAALLLGAIVVSML